MKGNYVFKVRVYHRRYGGDVYNVIATDDVKAREKALKIDERRLSEYSEDLRDEVEYCEIQCLVKLSV